VYVNFFIFERMRFSLAEGQQLVELCRGQFPSTWLLWGRSVAQVWPRAFIVRERNQGSTS
jgi:hypothetical protein